MLYLLLQYCFKIQSGYIIYSVNLSYVKLSLICNETILVTRTLSAKEGEYVSHSWPFSPTNCKLYLILYINK